MSVSPFNASSDFDALESALHGRRVLVELRTYRRSHHLSVAECRVSAQAGSELPVVELVIPLSYTDTPSVVRVPPDRFSHFLPATGTAEFQFGSVLYDNDDPDESITFAANSPIIVTIDHLK